MMETIEKKSLIGQTSLYGSVTTNRLTITQNKPACLAIAYTLTVHHTAAELLSDVSVSLLRLFCSNEEDSHNRIMVCFTGPETPVMSSHGALGKRQAGDSHSSINIHQINSLLYCQQSVSSSVLLFSSLKKKVNTVAERAQCGATEENTF